MVEKQSKINFDYLPEGVSVSLREDYGGGYYYLFEHYILGQIGRVFIEEKGEDETCLTYEIFMGETEIDNATLSVREDILQRIIGSSSYFFY